VNKSGTAVLRAWGLGLLSALVALCAHPAWAQSGTSQRPAKVETVGKGKTPAAKPPGKNTAKQAPRSSVKKAAVAKPRAAAVRKGAPKRVAGKKKPRRAQATAGSGLRVKRRASVPVRLSFGQIQGLRATNDPLDLASSVALVVDLDTDEVLFSKNSDAVLPIASITKLMTALVVTEAGLPLDEMLTVTPLDAAVRAGSRTRLYAGNRLTRGEMLHLALMASENRAAHVLGRTYPGGLNAFVAAMNDKALTLGMIDTQYVEPTGLSSDNQSSAHDLSLLVKAASEHPILRELSTMPTAMVPLGRKQVQFRNTNGLVHNPEWDIGLQKTGYISAAGRCVVMQTELAGRKLIMVLLDSAGKYSRIGDAERLRKWLSETRLLPSRPDLPALPDLADLKKLQSIGLPAGLGLQALPAVIGPTSQAGSVLPSALLPSAQGR